MWDSARQWEALCMRCNERLWAAAPGFSSWVCLIYHDEALCDGLSRMPSFLALDMRESCSHDYKQRGRSRCCNSSCRSWHESNDKSPALFGCCMLVSAFGGCRAGMPSAAEGVAPPEQCIRGEPTSLVSGLSPSRAVRHGRTYIPSEWAVEKAEGKQESLGHIAMSCRKITGILQNWYSMWWCAICGDVPFMMKWLDVSR